MIVEKAWGSTESLFDNSSTEVHIASVYEKGFTSKHYHKHKYNLLYIIHGSLLLKIWDDFDAEHSHTLTTGKKFIVNPGILHQFIALEQTHIIEIYFTDIDKNDIIRLME
jgi:quercetin dioxygenase-like cupin family protein